MSNRRRLKPPPYAVAFARAYRCGDCQSETGRPTLDSFGVWHIKISHDDSCPVLGGVVSDRAALDAAALATSAPTVIAGERREDD